MRSIDIVRPPQRAPAANVGAASMEATSVPAPARPPVIDLDHARKAFGSNVVLQDLSLTMAAGEIFGLIGPSGSGKSTAIHLLCGHLRPSGGAVRVFGQDPTTLNRAAKRRIGYLPQGFVLFPDLTVRQNIAFVAGLYGLSEWRHRRQIRAVLDLVQLWDARNRPARAVSGGMQRRIALAAALVHDPELLYVDEPTANLDPILRAHLWEHFRALRDRGRTLLVTTQYVDEAEYCDRVGLMYDGRLIATGKPQELRRHAFGGDMIDLTIERPLPAYTAALGAVPGVRGTAAQQDESLRVTVDDATSALPELLAALEAAGATVRSVGQYQPSFDEIFIRLIEEEGMARPSVGTLRSSDVAQRPDAEGPGS
jgi:ABC-2 type transport system ATP-binding protein